jgi:hypothetical protein
VNQLIAVQVARNCLRIDRPSILGLECRAPRRRQRLRQAALPMRSMRFMSAGAGAHTRTNGSGSRTAEELPTVVGLSAAVPPPGGKPRAEQASYKALRANCSRPTAMSTVIAMTSMGSEQ